MKRTMNDRHRPFLRPGVSYCTTAPRIGESNTFQNRIESVDKAQIRNNNLQLSFTQDHINPASLSPSPAFRGQFRPRLADPNRHRMPWPAAMNGFLLGTVGSQQIWRPITRFLPPRPFHSPVNYYRKATFPRTVHPFQETRRNARLLTQSNARSAQERILNPRTSASETSHNGKGHKNKNRISMRRNWQSLPEVSQCSADAFSFSVVTYNMLSDALLYENMFLYEDCSRDALSWEYRKEKLLAELLDYNAEILCLQEVDACHYESWFESKLHDAGYAGVFNQRTGGKPDGCAIFYRDTKFTLVKEKLVKYFTPRVRVLNKDNVGIVLLLKANTSDPEAENAFVCVANTHLLFNKKRGDIKLAQLVYLLAEIDDLAVLSQDEHRKTRCPVILCGDLNSLPYSPLYHFLVTGQLEYAARSPAVVSGQLAPSETRRGQNARRMTTPLLPWEFGVTLDCQWREQREGNSEVGSTKSQGRRSPCHAESKVGGGRPRESDRHFQDSETREERRWNDAERWNKEPLQHRAPSNLVCPSGTGVSAKHANSNRSLDPKARPESSPYQAVSNAMDDCDKTDFIPGTTRKLVHSHSEHSNMNTSIDQSRSGAGHGDCSPTAVTPEESDAQNEKTKHNKNGTISIPWQFTSVYPHRFPDGAPEVTTCHSKACCNVDYILYTASMRDRRSAAPGQHVQTGTLTLLGRLGLMRKTDFSTMLLPNHHFPSDHLSLHARFKLT